MTRDWSRIHQVASQPPRRETLGMRLLSWAAAMVLAIIVGAASGVLLPYVLAQTSSRESHHVGHRPPSMHEVAEQETAQAVVTRAAVGAGVLGTLVAMGLYHGHKGRRRDA